MRIFVVEDEPTLCSQLAQAIAHAGHTVEVAVDGATARYLGEVEDFDAVVLDLGLPLVYGLSVLHHWRAAGRNMPVLILTARSAWHEKVTGMDAGADDYLAKPFHMEELLALLMQRTGEVLSRTELSEHIYPQDSERDSNTIEVFVARLRKKLPPGSIETVRGLGYRLLPAEAAA